MCTWASGIIRTTAGNPAQLWTNGLAVVILVAGGVGLKCYGNKPAYELEDWHRMCTADGRWPLPGKDVRV